MQFKSWFETFTDILPYKWLQQSKIKWKAAFAVGKKKYIVEFNHVGHHDWICDFYLILNKSQVTADITGTGDAFAVFSTTIGIMKDFIEHARPVVSLEFNASEPSRQRLYQAIVKRMTASGEWESVETDYANQFKLMPAWAVARQHAY